VSWALGCSRPSKLPVLNRSSVHARAAVAAIEGVVVVRDDAFQCARSSVHVRWPPRL
jgi:hypothetical protein